MKPPQFWQSGGPFAAALQPLTVVTRIATARRVRRAGWVAPVPVLCCGNATVGGTGKTPLCMDMARRLRCRGVEVHILTRGYLGAARSVTRVDETRHGASDVGDEALLLAMVAPTWTGGNRAEAARAALAAGATALLMDDGLQHPSLAKSAAFLVIDGGAGFGNGRLLPAGPLREPVRSAAARCNAAVIIGGDVKGVRDALPPGLPVLEAQLSPDAAMRALAGTKVVAFAGIGRPQKFFDSLQEAGISMCETAVFADHHVYKSSELARLRSLAAACHAPLVTTPKDYVRLPAVARHDIAALGVTMRWKNEDALDELLRQFVP